MDIRIFDVSYDKSNSVALKLARFSDLHLHKYGDNSRAQHDLEEAAAEGRRFSFNGDMLDMIYTGDPRYTRARDRGDLDAKLNDDTEFLYEFLLPHVNMIDIVGTGNHEGAVLRHYHYDIIRGVLGLLNARRDKSLPPIYQGDYRGLELYRLKYSGGGGVRSFRVMRHHLRGGGAPVTKGMIDIARVSDGWDADFYHFGHKHTAIHDAGRMRYGVTSKGKEWQRTRQAVITPGYQESVKNTTKQIDRAGIDAPYEETFYTGTPQGYCTVDVSPLSSNGKEPIRVRAQLRTQ